MIGVYNSAIKLISGLVDMNEIIEHALKSNAWPFQEARAILKKINNKLPEKGYVLFETGYGPSGLPHIGTFGEVARTTIVRKAFEMISGMPTRLFCISDDMDGMRKIPDTVPDKDVLIPYMHLPLTKVPDPFGTHESFGHNMNARLRAFLDEFNFQYEFFSASECYANGTFNETLLKVLDKYEAIMAVMLPTLGEERQKTYSPFLPVCPDTGKVLQVPMISIDKANGTITYENENGKIITSEVTNGKCKLQWKPDLGMRWAAFDVDFEMYGKDHLINGPLYSKICSIVGGKVPHQLFYELFLDEKGEKISKSKGNGLTINQWLRYAPQESLAYFMYISPQKAKKLFFDVIPKCVDEYLSFLRAYPTQGLDKQLENPVYHIHLGNVPSDDSPVSYSMLLNLISACNTDDLGVLKGYVRNVAKDDEALNSPFFNRMLECAVNYYQDFIKPHKQFRAPTDIENKALQSLLVVLEGMDPKSTSEEIQNAVYAISREYEFEVKDWFMALYQILLGASQGPRFGSFVSLYGVSETIELIKSKLS